MALKPPQSISAGRGSTYSEDIALVPRDYWKDRKRGWQDGDEMDGQSVRNLVELVRSLLRGLYHKSPLLAGVTQHDCVA